MHNVRDIFSRFARQILAVLLVLSSDASGAGTPEIDPVALEHIFQLIRIEEALNEGNIQKVSGESMRLSKALDADHPEVARRASHLGTAPDIETARKRFLPLEEEFSAAFAHPGK